ncbi:GNAT family N-acetyltransferase [Rhodospirillaceae bacterium SYSU D60014]|uniref:GNAT family N-acetyltransferase n=1 Tax=Virgifigura deserti TaxID=2268457 RepID=UPI000E671E07
MTGDLVIRPASQTDARAIARVHVETWRSTYAGSLPDRVVVRMSTENKTAVWREMIGRRGSREAILVAAVPGAGVVGFASCGPAASTLLRPRSVLQAAEPYAGEVYTLYVLPDWQEKGIGRRLLCGCFRALAEAGLESAFLWVLASNPSRFFYEAMGGLRAGERDEALWGAVLHEAAYGWPDLSVLPPACRDG